MRQTISTIVFVLTFQSFFGQVATIQDSDGWTNIHKSPNGKSEIIHKIYENEVFGMIMSILINLKIGFQYIFQKMTSV